MSTKISAEELSVLESMDEYKNWMDKNKPGKMTKFYLKTKEFRLFVNVMVKQAEDEGRTMLKEHKHKGYPVIRI